MRVVREEGVCPGVTNFLVKRRDSRLNLYEGSITVSEFVKGVEGGKLSVENSQSRDRVGSGTYPTDKQNTPLSPT